MQWFKNAGSAESLCQVELVNVAQKRQPFRTWQIGQSALCHDPARPARKSRNVDEDGALSLDDRTRREALRSAFALSRVDVEAPAMVAADKLVAIELALAEQRALVRTRPSKARVPEGVRTATISSPSANSACGPSP